MLKKYISLIIGLTSLFYVLCLHAEPTSSIFRDATDPMVGDPNGKVTVVEFFDYRCIHCLNVAHTVDAFIKSHPDVRFVFKELPVFGAPSELGARAALAANLQNKYYEFHTALLANKKTINDELITTIAKKLGLDIEKFKKDIDSQEITAKLKSTYKLAISSKIRGTPAFFIAKTDVTDMKNTKLIIGEATQKLLDAAVQEAANK